MVLFCRALWTGVCEWFPTWPTWPGSVRVCHWPTFYIHPITVSDSSGTAHVPASDWLHQGLSLWLPNGQIRLFALSV